MDVSAAMAMALEGLTLQQSTYHIRTLDGRTPALKEFLQDATNDAVYVTKSTEPGFMNIILSKLKGTASASDCDKEFRNLQELIPHLKKRFTPTEKYQRYFEAIVNLRMKQTESVSDYYDRTLGVLSGAKPSL